MIYYEPIVYVQENESKNFPCCHYHKTLQICKMIYTLLDNQFILGLPYTVAYNRDRDICVSFNVTVYIVKLFRNEAQHNVCE